MTSRYWNQRADLRAVARAESMAMYRKTGDRRWRDIADGELEQELEYRRWANEEADRENAMGRFRVAA